MSEMTPIPGNIMFDGPMATKGYPLNKMCYSFNKAEARAAFLANEEAYCEQFELNDEQKHAVRARNVIALLDAGGSIYYLAKFAGILGLNVQDVGGLQTGMTTDEFKAFLVQQGEK
ncbi:protocatechuate 4,5-dioxygenase subunit alpha [Marinomonas sp. IMCC 4694]|uniref:protocatechuate 4,5-dioxygenase subunit alpha n=1 Tax=Marinomonas sp. IMCC 4694 TaxID=2605432 RepID=UPI0011E687DD|nr:protocatechuate 4,5-dioxygenase subunit alpha [Marinomonas sp. IMCC 4694]TYL48848.1 protocatechuate 4,5-dioxygenase subunit alpha [Marinomonas sp. IMCC 4694]